jgi:type II secretory pathway pseudopilin PulG
MAETVKTCFSCGKELPHESTACPACGAALGVGAPPEKKSRRLLWGGVGCLGALILLGLVAAAILPGTLTSPKRVRQRSQVAQVRSFATMVLAYQSDFKKAPTPTGTPPGQGWHFVRIGEIKPLLVPTYAKELPETDVYGQPYLYGFRDEDPMEFCIIATGSDGQRDSNTLPAARVETHCYESDVIWLNDDFLQVPEGPQHTCKKGLIF